MHQERTYPGRVEGTDLRNPDFAALARAYGAGGEIVSRTDEFAPAFERALAANKPVLLHLKLDPQALTMNATLDDLPASRKRSGGGALMRVAEDCHLAADIKVRNASDAARRDR